MTIWEVELFVYSPVKVEEIFRLTTQKGTGMNPFFSNVEISNFPEGIIIRATAFAPTSDLAHNAALIFIGHMLDCLIIDLREPLPMYLSFDGKRNSSKRTNVKRFIEKHEFQKAFDDAFYLAHHHPVILRAYGWYRKGLYNEDKFDIFLALWNCIEIVSSKYHTPDNRTRNGAKNQIWNCFITLWGECKDWPLPIAGNDNWIDENNEIRKNIAHGIANVNIDEVQRITDKIGTLRLVSYLFLRDCLNLIN